MLDESNTLNNNVDAPEPQPEEKGNRTFLIVGGIFAALIFLTLVCMAIWFLVIVPRRANTQASQDATVTAQSIAIAQAKTTTAEAALITPTSLASPIPTITRTKTVSVATSTLVVIVATPLGSPVSDPATMSALQTQLAGQMTQTAEGSLGAVLATAGTETQAAVETQLAGKMTQTAAVSMGTRAIGGEGPLPTTGFFDEVGLPLLLLLTFTLLAVIFVARRMRKVPTR